MCRNLKAKRVQVREEPNPEDDEDIHARKNASLASLKDTKFVVGDYGKSKGTPAAFDTITCLSVAKWIHFHHGDDGMKFVFQKFFDSLRPKGYLIIELQEWSSYQQAKRKQVRNISQLCALLETHLYTLCLRIMCIFHLLHLWVIAAVESSVVFKTYPGHICTIAFNTAGCS